MRSSISNRAQAGRTAKDMENPAVDLSSKSSLERSHMRVFEQRSQNSVDLSSKIENFVARANASSQWRKTTNS